MILKIIFFSLTLIWVMNLDQLFLDMYDGRLKLSSADIHDVTR
jgi:hypothetical protein